MLGLDICLPNKILPVTFFMTGNISTLKTDKKILFDTGNHRFLVKTVYTFQYHEIGLMITVL